MANIDTSDVNDMLAIAPGLGDVHGGKKQRSIFADKCFNEHPGSTSSSALMSKIYIVPKHLLRILGIPQFNHCSQEHGEGSVTQLQSQDQFCVDLKQIILDIHKDFKI